MHATIDVRFECSIDDEKTLPVAAIAEFVTEQDIEAAIVEELVERLDERQVEAYCGEKHATGNGTKRFQRAGTTTRSAVTTAGELNLTLHTVEDTAAEGDEASYFRPVEDAIAFDGQKQYQEDVSLRSVVRATDLSYRDAADGDGSGLLPSPSTINRRVKEYGDTLSGFLRERLAGTEAETVGADGTKCHSQDHGRTYQHVAVTLEQGAEEPTATLLDVSVNAPWDTIATTLDETDAIAEDATVVSDAEERLVEAFTDDDREHQLDLCHIGRTTSHMLWEDDAFSLAEREEIVAEVTSDVFHLKHSVETHPKSSALGRGLRMQLLGDELDSAVELYQNTREEYLLKEVRRDDILDSMVLAVAACDDSPDPLPSEPASDEPRIYFPGFDVPVIPVE